MENVFPSYYNDFKCIGGACPDTCCAGWEIMIDPKSMKRYKAYKGPFAKRLKRSINYLRKSFRQKEDKRCAFLNDNGLCDMITACGEEMLCHTCDRYPRHVEVFENLREYSIGISCPVACEMILTQDHFSLVTRENDKEDPEDEDFDELLFSQLLDARSVLFEIAENKAFSLHERMALLLTLGHQIQKKVTEGELFGMEDLYPPYQDAGMARKILKKTFSQMDDVTQAEEGEALFGALHQLENLMYAWPGYLMHCETILFGEGQQGFEEMMQYEVSDDVLTQILCYFIYTYFSGAVYDGRPYAKIKFAVVSALYTEMLLKVSSWENRGLTMEAYVDVVHRYAREVEHSDPNLKAMDRMLTDKDCFRIQSLCRLLAD